MPHRLQRIGVVLISCALGYPALAERPAARPLAQSASVEPVAASWTAGFRMEGDPELEAVFGDANAFRGQIDRFFQLSEAMDVTRAAFSRHVRDTLSTLVPHPRGCPLEAVAPMYAAAYRAGREFRELGAELEAHHAVIAMLDELGETAGLTPDYRWRVRRSEPLYQASLRDYREMRSLFDRQLGGELANRRCDLDNLLAVGERALEERARQAVAEAEIGPATTPPPRRIALPEPEAAATFFIDNTQCGEPMRVFVDGVAVGEVAASVKAAFQAPPGRHGLCVIPTASAASCGDPGTLRSIYVHDGWSMSLRCATQ